MIKKLRYFLTGDQFFRQNKYRLARKVYSESLPEFRQLSNWETYFKLKNKVALCEIELQNIDMAGHILNSTA